MTDTKQPPAEPAQNFELQAAYAKAPAAPGPRMTWPPNHPICWPRISDDQWQTGEAQP
jgi:hypothetical protein